jgi:hypothetical protein
VRRQSFNYFFDSAIRKSAATRGTSALIGERAHGKKSTPTSEIDDTANNLAGGTGSLDRESGLLRAAEKGDGQRDYQEKRSANSI